MKRHGRGQSVSPRGRSSKGDRANPEGVSISKKSKAKLTTSPSPARKSPKAARKNTEVEVEQYAASPFRSPMKRKGPSGDNSSSSLDMVLTPESLSQISSIMPPDDSTMMSTKCHSPSKKRRQADRTMELAVQRARGEPDGADGSFRKSPKSPKVKASRKLTDIPEVEESPVKAHDKENSTMVAQKTKCMKVGNVCLWCRGWEETEQGKFGSDGYSSI